MNFRFFLHVFMYPFFLTIFLDPHPKSISPKKQLSKDLQTILFGHKSCSFFWQKISRRPGRSTSLEENDRFRSKADFCRFGHRDLHRLMLKGRILRWDFCFLKMLSWWIFLAKMSFFQFCSSYFWGFFWRSTCEKMAKTQSMVFENVCWQHVMMEPKKVVTQDLVQVLMTA